MTQKTETAELVKALQRIPATDFTTTKSNRTIDLAASRLEALQGVVDAAEDMAGQLEQHTLATADLADDRASAQDVLDWPTQGYLGYALEKYKAALAASSADGAGEGEA